MLRDAVTLDAGMSAGEAMRRLAQHGYWLDADVGEARAWLEAYAARIRAAAAASTARSAVPAPASRDDARVAPQTLTAAEAARRLARPLDGGRVVIRRQEGPTIFWYARRVDEVLHALTGAPPDASVRDALQLQETRASPAAQASALPDDGARFVGVVLRGQDPVGVGELDPVPPPPSLGTTRSVPRSVPRGVGGAAPAPAPPVEVRAYPMLDAPAVTYVDTPFDLVVGLADAPVAGLVTGGALSLQAPAGATSLPVEVHVIADGFDAPDGWRHVLDVEVARPTAARVTVRLVPRAQPEAIRLTTLSVRYVVDGVARGSAARHVVVAAAAPDSAIPFDDRGHQWPDAESPSAALALTATGTPADVELDIAKLDGNAARGRFRCVVRNAHGVPVPDGSLEIDLGDDAKTFAKQLIDEVRQWSDEPIVDQLLEGVGATVAGKLPPEFWAVLRAVAARLPDRPVTLQLNSADPYVPWELALVDPPLDPTRPRYLAAQVVMGRWILGDGAVAAPPSTTLAVRTMAVMAGMYNVASGLRALPQAQAEALALTTSYASLPAVPLNCTPADLQVLLSATLVHQFRDVGGAQAVHFAGHGEVDPTRPGDAALYLNNGKPLTPLFFRKSRLGREHAPFIFLNACMVGTGGEMLGDYGGFPGNCLAGGFTGLVAPLWAVNDEVAKSFALAFYQEALADRDSRSVAEVLRDLRANYRADAPIASYLAYVYYGNPHLTLTRTAADT